MFILGIVIYLLGVTYITLAAVYFNTQLMANVLIDMPTIVLFIVMISAVIVTTGNFKTLVYSINALISKKYSISAADKERGIRLFKLLGKTVIYTSVLATAISLMVILIDFSDPAQLGPKIALALYSILFGTGLNLIVINPAIDILQTRYNLEEKQVISEKQIIDKLLELCYSQGISPEEILDAKEIHFKKQ